MRYRQNKTINNKNPKNKESGLRKFTPFIAALDPTVAKNYLEICKKLGVHPDRYAGEILKDYVETMQRKAQVFKASSDKESDIVKYR